MHEITMRTLLALILAVLAVGCGQKGPLYFPSEKPAAKAPKPAPAQTTDDAAKRPAQ